MCFQDETSNPSERMTERICRRGHEPFNVLQCNGNGGGGYSHLSATASSSEHGGREFTVIFAASVAGSEGIGGAGKGWDKIIRRAGHQRPTETHHFEHWVHN